MFCTNVRIDECHYRNELRYEPGWSSAAAHLQLGVIIPLCKKKHIALKSVRLFCIYMYMWKQPSRNSLAFSHVRTRYIFIVSRFQWLTNLCDCRRRTERHACIVKAIPPNHLYKYNKYEIVSHKNGKNFCAAIIGYLAKLNQISLSSPFAPCARRDRF